MGPTVVKHAKSGVTDHVTYLYVPTRRGPRPLRSIASRHGSTVWGFHHKPPNSSVLPNVDQV